MNKTRLFKKTIIAATIALASQQAVAAGFQLNAQSATGLGRAFAGDAVIADNASSMARNPATMALFDETAMSLGFVSITSMIEVKDATYNNINGSQLSSNYDDAGATSIVPNLHIIVPVNDKFAWGVNAYSNFGTKTDFGDSFVGSEYGGQTEILSVNFGLAGSYRIDKQWSVGAGLDFIYGQGTLKRSLSDSFYDGPVYPANIDGGQTSYLDSQNGSSRLDVDSADGWGVGFNIGTVYELDENNRFGLAYRYSPEITAEDGDQKIKLPLPDMAEFSGYHRLENSKFAVHYSAQWIGWKAFEDLKLNNVAIKEYNWKNTYHISLGGTYYLNQDWTLRAGYMFDESAQDKTTSFSVPDSDRNWLSTGFTYHMSPKSNIDFGFTYLIGSDVDVTEKTANPNFGQPGQPEYISSMTGTTHADAILVGLQYSRTF
ncbi:outer membrane protein transport protein [Vibrio sp. VB16]|uniref:outer membrane protein transport protein n=1 Tax=Vibrio sp. VB16 TaxID=2785746 RepID=UPI00189DA052|nr:outer membrane protein transport protein [Vibrio sp. VB16]UGA53972.1 outer membrane protein transport protein [Vibrio sp. VB16]